MIIGNILGRPEQTFTSLSASELSIGFRDRRFSVEEVVRASLERIEHVQDRFNAFTEIYAEQSLDAARRADLVISGGDVSGPLCGVPCRSRISRRRKGN